MKKFVGIGTMILLLCGIAPAQTPAQPAPTAPPAVPPSKAKLYIDNTDFQFGWIPSDAYVSHAYWLHSRGEDSLKILSVRPG